jgi:hypothetical protein
VKYCWQGTNISFLLMRINVLFPLFIREEREQKLQRKLETTTERKLRHGSFGRGCSFVNCCA